MLARSVVKGGGDGLRQARRMDVAKEERGSLYHSGPESLFTTLSFPSNATFLTPDVQQREEIFSRDDLSETELIFHA